MSRPRLVLVVLLLAVVSVGAAHVDEREWSATKQSEPPHAAPPIAEVSGSLPLAVVGADHPGELIAIVEAVAYQAAIGEQRERERLAGEEAERLRATRAAANVSVARTGTPPAPAAVSDGGCAYADAIRAAWAGTGDEQWAVSTAMRESHCTPGARNPSGASGIFQLMMPLHRAFVAGICGDPADDLVFDAGCNIAAARAMYDGSGRRPWSF